MLAAAPTTNVARRDGKHFVFPSSPAAATKSLLEIAGEIPLQGKYDLAAQTPGAQHFISPPVLLEREGFGYPDS